jgi:hypothetical protein
MPCRLQFYLHLRSESFSSTILIHRHWVQVGDPCNASVVALSFLEILAAREISQYFCCSASTVTFLYIAHKLYELERAYT